MMGQEKDFIQMQEFIMAHLTWAIIIYPPLRFFGVISARYTGPCWQWDDNIINHCIHKCVNFKI